MFSSISQLAMDVEIRRFGKQEPLCGVTCGAMAVRDAPGYSYVCLGRVPAPMVLELCQWDEGRGLTPPQTLAGAGYSGDGVSDWSHPSPQAGPCSSEISKSLVSPRMGGSSQAPSRTPTLHSPLAATSQVTLIKV